MQNKMTKRFARMQASRANDGLLEIRRSTIRGMGSVREANEDKFLLAVMQKAVSMLPTLRFIYITMPDHQKWELDVRAVDDFPHLL